MKWKVNQSRGAWNAEVVAVGDPKHAALEGKKVAVVLTYNIDFRRKHFSVDADWWQRPSFNELLYEQAVILVRRFQGFDENDSAIVGNKIGMFRIENVQKGGTKLSFDLAERLAGGIE